MENIQQGCIGVDKAGSISNFPIVIASLYSKEYKTFIDTMKEVRKIAVKEKNIFQSKREIKSKDIKNDFYGELRSLVIRKQSYAEKLESLFWYKSIAMFCINKKTMPKRVYLDFNYTNDRDLRVFEEDIASLFSKFNAVIPLISSHDSKDNDGIALSDLLSGFLMRNKSLLGNYKNNVKTLARSDVENELKFLFKL